MFFEKNTFKFFIHTKLSCLVKHSPSLTAGTLKWWVFHKESTIPGCHFQVNLSLNLGALLSTSAFSPCQGPVPRSAHGNRLGPTSRSHETSKFAAYFGRKKYLHVIYTEIISYKPCFLWTKHYNGKSNKVFEHKKQPDLQRIYQSLSVFSVHSYFLDFFGGLGAGTGFGSTLGSGTGPLHQQVLGEISPEKPGKCKVRKNKEIIKLCEDPHDGFPWDVWFFVTHMNGWFLWQQLGKYTIVPMGIRHGHVVVYRNVFLSFSSWESKRDPPNATPPPQEIRP